MNFPLRLFELLAGTGPTLLLYVDDTAPQLDLVEIEKVLAGRARMYVLTADPALRLGGHPVILDAEAEFRDAYGATAGSGYLVRPDGYLGFRAAPLTTTALHDHLERVFAPL